MGSDQAYTSLTRNRCSSDSAHSADDLPRFLQAKRSWRDFFFQPAAIGVMSAFTVLIAFAMGFGLGRSELGLPSQNMQSGSQTMSPVDLAPSSAMGEESEDITPNAWNMDDHSPSIDNLLDILKQSSTVDLYQEYGLDPSTTQRYSEPLKDRIAIVNVDTRLWEPWSTAIKDMQPSHWGFLNHYLYAKLHGYTFIHSQVPSPPEGIHATWAKVNEQFRLTMMDKYQFVVVLDADTIFTDMRIPLEPLFSHWGINESTALAGGLDLAEAVDIRGHTNINSGFLITQKTPVTEQMFRDWALCPTNVTYPNCSIWKDNYFHEQSALSNFIRYDYQDHILEMPYEEIHGGKFITHYWGGAKGALKEASLQAIVGDHSLHNTLKQLGRTWLDYHQRVLGWQYQGLLYPPGSEDSHKTSTSITESVATTETTTATTTGATAETTTETTTNVDAETTAETTTETHD